MELKKGELARIADFSATGQFNQTNVLVTVVSKPRPSPASFLPLTVISQFVSQLFMIQRKLFLKFSIVFQMNFTGRLSSQSICLWKDTYKLFAKRHGLVQLRSTGLKNDRQIHQTSL